MGHGKAVRDELRAPTRALRRAIPEVYRGYRELHDAALEARNKAEGLFYSSDKAMEEFGTLLDPGERETLLLELEDCRAALQTDDLAVVEDAVARLEVAAQRIGEAIYAAADSSSSGGDIGGGM